MLVLVAVLLSGGGACGGVVVVLGFGRAMGLLSSARGGRGVMGLRVRRKWPAQKIPYLWMAGAAKLRAVFCLHVGGGSCPLPSQAMRQSQNRWASVSVASSFLFVCHFGIRPGFAQFAAAQQLQCDACMNGPLTTPRAQPVQGPDVAIAIQSFVVRLIISVFFKV